MTSVNAQQPSSSGAGFAAPNASVSSDNGQTFGARGTSTPPGSSTAAPIEDPFAQTPPALAKKTKTDWRLVAAILVIGLILLAILIGIVVFLAVDPDRTRLIRDVVIILFGFIAVVATFVMGVLLAVISWQLQMLLYLLRNELKPMLLNVNEMVASVRGTTLLVSESVARPTIRLSSLFAGVRGAGGAFKSRMSRKPADPKP